jgi:hypothetical protein
LEGKEPNEYTGCQEVNPVEKEKDKKHQSLPVRQYKDQLCQTRILKNPNGTHPRLKYKKSKI